MNRKILLGAVAAALLMSASSVIAFDLPKSSAVTAPASGGGDAVAMQEGLVKNYTDAAGYMAAAQLELAKAFELKDQAAALEAEATTLNSGATLDKDGIKKSREVTTGAGAAIGEKISSGAELSDEGKKHYAASFGPLVKGVTATSKLPAEASAFSDAAQTQIKSASLMEKASVTSKLSAGAYLAKEIPGFSATSMSNFKNIVTYAQNKGIPVPKDATALLGN